MNNEDGWDWPWLYFLGVYVFRLPEERFWKLYPKQLFTLTTEYTRYKGDTGAQTDNKHKSKKSNEPVYIDQLF